jgi:hypothetical protein
MATANPGSSQDWRAAAREAGNNWSWLIAMLRGWPA